MKRKFVVNRIFVLLLLLLPVSVSAAVSLPKTLQNYFNQQYLKKDKMTIIILTPAEQLPSCNKLQIKPAPSQQYWGKLTLPVSCDEKNIIFA